jgi:hypothetical protein
MKVMTIVGTRPEIIDLPAGKSRKFRVSNLLLKGFI